MAHVVPQPTRLRKAKEVTSHGVPMPRGKITPLQTNLNRAIFLFILHFFIYFFLFFSLYQKILHPKSSPLLSFPIQLFPKLVHLFTNFANSTYNSTFSTKNCLQFHIFFSPRSPLTFSLSKTLTSSVDVKD